MRTRFSTDCEKSERTWVDNTKCMQGRWCLDALREERVDDVAGTVQLRLLLFCMEATAAS